MYAWIFRHLPGPRWLRVLEAIVLVAAVIAVLFLWVFPAVAPYVPMNRGTVGSDG